jgi:UDPglucose--hexose-1-phosphate uridylyltransferase
MSLLRFDPTTSDWVIFAPSRARRPHELCGAGVERTPEPESKICPFCPGNEQLTPTEIFRVPACGLPKPVDWRVRVVSNLFPALRIEEPTDGGTDGSPIFRHRGGCGAHEVIIECPDHDVCLAQQPVEQIEALLYTLQQRYNDLLRDPRFQMIVLFKNHGEGAGTSLRHPHCQLIATPVVPRHLRTKLAIAADYFDMTGQCLYCVLRNEEVAADLRVIAQNPEYVAFLPYASHVPFETWILPRTHHASFADVEATKLRLLADILKTVLQKLFVGLDNPDYNLAINTVPRGDEDKTYFLWHISILPRLTTPAGFELGSGMSINTVLPEEAADYLRSVISP